MFENYEKRNEDFYKVVTEMQRKGSPGHRRASVGYAIRKALQSEAPSFNLSRGNGREGEEPWVALDYVLSHHRPSRFFISEAYAIKLVMRFEREQKTTNGKKR